MHHVENVSSADTTFVGKAHKNISRKIPANGTTTNIIHHPVRPMS